MTFACIDLECPGIRRPIAHELRLQAHYCSQIPPNQGAFVDGCIGSITRTKSELSHADSFTDLFCGNILLWLVVDPLSALLVTSLHEAEDTAPNFHT